MNLRTAVVLAILLPTKVSAALPCDAPGWSDRCASWVSILDHEPGHATTGIDAFYTAVADTEGTIFAAGSSTSAAGDADALLAAYRAEDGSALWVKHRQGTLARSDAFLDVVLSPGEGTVYAVGNIDAHHVQPSSDISVVAFDTATGAERWALRHDGGGRDVALAASVDPRDGMLYVTGQSEGSQMDAILLAIDGATGTLEWSERLAYGGAPVGWDSTYAVAVDTARDQVIVAGDTYNGSTGRFDGIVAAFRTGSGTQGGGEPVWTKRLPASSLYRLGLADGAVILAGKAWRSGAPMVPTFERSDSYTVALDPTDGSLSWSDRVVAAAPQEGERLASALAVAPGGDTAFVASVHPGATDLDEDMLILGFDVGTGERVLSHSYSSPGHLGDLPIAMIATDNNVIVTGASTAGPPRARGLSDTNVYVSMPVAPVQGEAVTFAIDTSTGERTWTARLNPSDAGTDVAFSWDLVASGGLVVAVGYTAHASNPLADGQNRADGLLAAYER